MTVLCPKTQESKSLKVPVNLGSRYIVAFGWEKWPSKKRRQLDDTGALKMGVSHLPPVFVRES